MAKSKTEKWTSDALLGRLRAKYALPSYAFCPEVPNATSLDKRRSCDAIAMGCWKSVGIRLHGFEIKVSRGDWTRELQDREKAAVFEQYCHYWWIVAPPNVVKPEELPASWGLIVPNKSGLRTVSAADLRSPDPIPHTFLAAIMRRMQQRYSENEVEEIRRAAYREAYDSGRKSVQSSEQTQERIANQWRERYEQLEKSVMEFEKASGLGPIRQWTGQSYGQRFALLQRLLSSGQTRDLENMVARCRMFAEDAEAMAAEIRKFQQMDVPA